MKKNYYIVFVYDLITKQSRHHGQIWSDFEKAKAYRDYCNEQYDIMHIDKIAHIETVTLVDE